MTMDSNASYATQVYRWYFFDERKAEPIQHALDPLMIGVSKYRMCFTSLSTVWQSAGGRQKLHVVWEVHWYWKWSWQWGQITNTHDSSHWSMTSGVPSWHLDFPQGITYSVKVHTCNLDKLFILDKANRLSEILAHADEFHQWVDCAVQIFNLSKRKI